MIKFSIRDKVSKPQHIFLIASVLKNEFDFPEKVEAYFQKRLAESREKSKSATVWFQYNYLGTSVNVVLTNEHTITSKLREEVRRYAAQAADAVNQLKGTEVFIYNQTKLDELSLSAAEGMYLSSYQFLKHKPSAKAQHNTLRNVVVVGKSVNKSQLHSLQSVCEAVAIARDLVNEPVNVLNASGLAQAFKKMGKDAGFKVEVYHKKEITRLKMGGLLAVNAGSVDEPTFTVMEYKPAGAKNKKPMVLVGKGVVYDTGGLSLKPTPNSMDSMKCDMAGAAAVGATMYALAKAGVKKHVIGLVPATDNRPGFNAFAPGDIITMMDGSTVEMLNSDAEGRMILADALHFAKRFKPELVIDIATLTGAAVAAIGTSGIVGMGTLEGRLRTDLINASFAVHERIAEFPFWDDFDELLKSDLADQKNLGGPYAGSITAGRFLLKYTDYPYFHLDIAGPAFLAARDGYRLKGGTGCGVRLFFEFLSHT